MRPIRRSARPIDTNRIGTAAMHRIKRREGPTESGLGRRRFGPSANGVLWLC